jgi:pyruvate,water dikinase
MTNQPTQIQPNKPDYPGNPDRGDSKPLLCRLAEIEGSALPIVGGKAFRLALLNQQGFNVPPGLVLTTHFFETQIRHARLTPLWAGSPDVAVTAEALDWLADALKTRPLAKKLAQALNTELERTFGPEINSFAVRSSVIDEDHRDHTFAGIHLTELAVPRTMVPVAVTRCWASALSDRAIRYRQHHGMSIQSIRVAVLIQAMLAPTISGVSFTINPLTGARDEMAIEATWGLGNALVSGDIQPHFYRLARKPPDYPIVEYRPGNVQPPANLANGEHDRPLSAQALAELAHQLEQIQALMGEPQDVEWARQNQQFFILQTRPIANLPEAQPKADQEWTRGHYPEFLPELPSPFFGSLLERSQNQLLAFFKEVGLEIAGHRPYEKLILGRPYLNVTLLKRLMAQVGLSSDQLLSTLLGYTKPAPLATRPKIFSVDWGQTWHARHSYRLVYKKIRQAQHALQQTRLIISETIAGLAAVEAGSPAAKRLEQLGQIEMMYQRLAVTDLGLGLGIVVLTGLGSQVIAPIAKAPITTMQSLASKELKLSRDELNQALLSLSRFAAGHDEIKALLFNNLQRLADDIKVFGQAKAMAQAGAIGGTEPPGDVAPGPLATFKRDFNQLLVQYGERGSYEADPGWLRYRDDPVELLQLIGRQVKSEPWLNRAHETEADPTWPGLVDPPQGLNRLFPWRIWLAGLLIRRLRELLEMREQLNTLKAEAMAACRGWVLKLGQHWVEQGWLEQPDDLFYLKLEEIERMFRVEAGVAATLSSTVQARKETYQTYENTKLPFSLKDSEIASIQLGVGFSSETSPAAGVTIGLPISPGQARGTVVVVRHPDEFEKLADDIILVMPSTDPAWLALLSQATGLIVETGGLLSHGSVIAREYGLPAIANIPQATQRFQTGDKVLVDGSTGVIQLLEPHQPDRAATS